MKILYPEIEPNRTHLLDTGDGHQVYFEECGNTEGIPVIFLHGGPGSGCKPHHRCFFNPDRYRIVLMDQRGTGRSTPSGELNGNTTWGLVADMESIRQQLGISKWILFGGSWGATLALLYAQAHSEYVLGMVLRGSFLARQQDVDWFLKDGVNRIYPEAWNDFSKTIPPGVGAVAHYYQQLKLDGSEAREAARAWDQWGGAVVLGEDFDPEMLAGDVPDSAYHQALIETHYATHQYFIEEDQILMQSERLPAVPTYLIHGRRDLMCPVESAWALKQKLSHAELQILLDATHLAQGESMVDALVDATDRMADQLDI